MWRIGTWMRWKQPQPCLASIFTSARAEVSRTPLLRNWRFFLVSRPFNKQILFYEVLAGELVLGRALHGQRDLPRRLLETPIAG